MIILIDYENTNEAGLEGVELLNKEDIVYMFYSDHANAISKPLVSALVSSQCELHFVKLGKPGKNALD